MTALPSTIAAPLEHETVIKKSVFLTHLAPIASMEEADAIIAGIRKQRWDARHHCTAMVLGVHADRQRSNDDGEPSGTAGVPMLEVLRRREMTDLVAVVSRWFGGIKLGAGGLVRAYGGAVAEALDAATPVRRAWLTSVTVEVPHADAGRVLAFCHQWADAHGATLDAPSYGRAATLGIRLAPAQLADFEADLAAISSGTLAAVAGATEVVDVRG